MAKELGRGLVLALGLLSAFGPLAIDVYLPAMPALTAELGIDATLGQATLSASLLGLALGQLLLGPLSDRFGRRTPLLAGLAGFTVMSLVCAAAPNIWMLVAARFVQGVGGSSGIVISRAIIRDLTSGAAAARAFALVAAVLGIAPVLAPLLGGGLLLVTNWRGLFVALAVIGLALVALAWWQVPDTLPVEARTRERRLRRDLAETLRNRSFRIHAFVLATGSLALFSYVSMSAMVYEHQFGLNEQQFSLLFAAMSVGMFGGSTLSRRLVARHRVRTLALAALSVASCASAVLLVLSLFDAPLWAVAAPQFFAIALHGAILANVTALAMSSVERAVGSASALLGALQMGTGAVVPPLASLGGVSLTVMAATMFSGVAVALVTLATRRFTETTH